MKLQQQMTIPVATAPAKRPRSWGRQASPITPTTARITTPGMLKVRLASVKRRLGRRMVVGGRILGEMEEWFLAQLTPGDTFLFSGEVLRFEGLDEIAHARVPCTTRLSEAPEFRSEVPGLLSAVVLWRRTS